MPRRLRTRDCGVSPVEIRSAAADKSGMEPDETLLELIKHELAAAEVELRDHMASWEYAFAMGSSRNGGGNHPMHRQTRERTQTLIIRCRDLKARLAEHEL
jgi:hypothetical protein